MANATGLSVATIRNLETGYLSPRSAEVIRQAVEAEGWEFTEGDGIRRKTNEITVLREMDSTELFFRDILQTAKTKRTDVLAVLRSQKMLIGSLGMTQNGDLSRFKQLKEAAALKCILTENQEISVFTPWVDFRSLPQHYVGPSSFYVYGNKYAVVLPEGTDSFKFVIFRMIDLAQSYEGHFETLWKVASPLAEKSGVRARVAQG